MKRMFDCGMMKSEKKHFLTKADIGLIVGVAAAALVIWGFMSLHRVQGSYALVSCDGEPVFRIPLLEMGTAYYLWTEDEGVRELSEEEWEEMRARTAAEKESGAYNMILCWDGEISVEEANCPDGICVHHVAISRTGENIICLPHKVVIEIIGSEENKLDGVVY